MFECKRKHADTQLLLEQIFNSKSSKRPFFFIAPQVQTLSVIGRWREEEKYIRKITWGKYILKSLFYSECYRLNAVTTGKAKNEKEWEYECNIETHEWVLPPFVIWRKINWTDSSCYISFSRTSMLQFSSLLNLNLIKASIALTTCLDHTL